MILSFVVSLIFSFHLFALSIRVLPGGIPVGSAEHLMAEGIRLGSSQLLRQAWEAYEKAVQLEPASLMGYLQLGRIYFHLSLLNSSNDRDYELAKAYAEKAVSLSPKSSDAHHVLGMVLSGRGAYIDAIDELHLAWSLNPANEYILGDLASIHLALRQPEKAVDFLEGKSLRTGWSYFVLGLAWLQKGEKGKALINFKKAEKSGFSEYWLNMAYGAVQKNLPIPIPFVRTR